MGEKLDLWKRQANAPRFWHEAKLIVGIHHYSDRSLCSCFLLHVGINHKKLCILCTKLYLKWAGAWRIRRVATADHVILILNQKPWSFSILFKPNWNDHYLCVKALDVNRFLYEQCVREARIPKVGNEKWKQKRALRLKWMNYKQCWDWSDTVSMDMIKPTVCFPNLEEGKGDRNWNLMQAHGHSLSFISTVNFYRTVQTIIPSCNTNIWSPVSCHSWSKYYYYLLEAEGEIPKRKVMKSVHQIFKFQCIQQLVWWIINRPRQERQKLFTGQKTLIQGWRECIYGASVVTTLDISFLTRKWKNGNNDSPESHKSCCDTKEAGICRISACIQ